tara:strand:+ start:61 stop:903 length:843 start_codon:yes stop_codon:yes gene_type:complete
MYIKGLFETFKILGRLGIKPKDVIGLGGDVVKMGKSLFNTRVNPKLLEFIAKKQKIPTKIVEDIKIHARTLKNASESQKKLFEVNIRDILNAKTVKPPVTSVQKPVTSVKELSPLKQFKKNIEADAAGSQELFKGWKPTVIKGGKDKLATGGRVKFESGSGLKLSPIVSLRQTGEIVGPNENINVDVNDRTYGLAGIYEGDNWYGGGKYLKGNVKVDVTQEGKTLFADTMSKDDMMQLYVGLGEREGNHVEIGTDGEGNYTLNIIKSFAKGGIANHFRKK